jgi:hypothetical protein
MRSLLSLLLVLVLAILSPASAGAASGDDAVSAAEGWLDLVDRERYRLSWDAAGAALKDEVSKEEWAQTVGATRLHRGLVLARRLVESEPTEAVAGLPSGDYVLVSFETAFRATGDSIESLILAREGEARWKVVAYFVRPSP